MIVDSHCHAGKGDGLTGPWDTVAPLDRYLKRAAEAGIDRTVLLPVFDSDYRQANRRLAAIVRRRPDRLTAYAMVHPVRDAGKVGELVTEAVSRYRFRGIKVHRRDGRATREIAEVARAYGLPVLYDVMGEVWHAELLATEYPTVTWVIPHLGSFADDWRAHAALIDLMARARNVHADTSGVRRFDYLVEAVQRIGPSRLLFGSDGPWFHPGLELAKIRALGLTPAAEQLVLSGNWLRLTGRLSLAPRDRPQSRVPTGWQHAARPAEAAGRAP